MQAMFSISSGESVGDEPGLWSVATAIGTPASRSASTGGSLRLAQEVERARQQHGDRAGAAPSPRTPASLRYSRWSQDSAPNSAASAAPPLSLSCSACSFTGRPSARAASNTRRVCAGVKPMRSQNASTASTSPSACSAGSQAQHRVDVVVGAAVELRRQRVRGQAGGAHRRAAARAPSRRATRRQRASCVARQAVAGLDLERGHAFGHQRAARAGGRREQRAVAGRARGGDGRADAAAGARDVLVARALQAQLELARALAAVDQVGVAVDQAGRDQRAAEVVLGVDASAPARQVGVGADPAQDRRRRPAARRARSSPSRSLRRAWRGGRCARGCRHRVGLLGVERASHQPATGSRRRCRGWKLSAAGALAEPAPGCRRGMSVVVASARQRPATARRGRSAGPAVPTASPATTGRIAPGVAAQHQVQVARRAVEQAAVDGAPRRRNDSGASPARQRCSVPAISARRRRPRAPRTSARRRGSAENGPSASMSATLMRTRQSPPSARRAVARDAAAVAPGLRRRRRRGRSRCRRHGLKLPSSW